MKTYNALITRYITPTNIKLVSLFISLVLLAFAAGAPGAESGIGGR